ncbi:MAG: M23 family metallopeptidase [Firmicutes bacterium]|nr:M23 family metallopeptidase [Bacillota bacterium]
MKINAEALFNAINNAKDKYIEEAWDREALLNICRETVPAETEKIPLKSGKTSWLPYALTAAALALTIGIGMSVPKLQTSAGDGANTESTQPAGDGANTEGVQSAEVYPVQNYEGELDLSLYIDSGSYTAELIVYEGDPVYAVTGGRVIYEDYYDAAYGNVLVIEETDSPRKICLTGIDFAPSLSIGDNVKKGDAVGTVAKSFTTLECRMIYAVLVDDLPRGSYFEGSAYGSWLNRELAPVLAGREDMDLGSRNPYKTIPAENGEAVYSPWEGEVIWSGSGSGTYGYVLGIKYEGEILVYFYYLSELDMELKEGDYVQRGQRVGSVRGNELGYYVVAL